MPEDELAHVGDDALAELVGEVEPQAGAYRQGDRQGGGGHEQLCQGPLAAVGETSIDHAAHAVRHGQDGAGRDQDEQAAQDQVDRMAPDERQKAGQGAQIAAGLASQHLDETLVLHHGAQARARGAGRLRGGRFAH
jgi:hypothetical protein